MLDEVGNTSQFGGLVPGTGANEDGDGTDWVWAIIDVTMRNWLPRTERWNMLTPVIR